MPASSAAWIVAMLSVRSAGPYMPDMPMAPRPIAETTGPLLPRRRCCMVSSLFVQPGAKRRHGVALAQGGSGIGWGAVLGQKPPRLVIGQPRLSGDTLGIAPSHVGEGALDRAARRLGDLRDERLGDAERGGVAQHGGDLRAVETAIDE